MNEQTIHLNGTLLGQDTSGKQIVLQWETIDGRSSLLTRKLRAASDILSETYTQQELVFAQKHPEAIEQEHFLKSLAPLFRDTTIDWMLIERRIRDIFKQFFTQTDFSQFSKEHEKHIFVTAFDQQTNERIGFMQFIMSSDNPNGSVKVGMFGLVPHVEGQNVQDMLMSSIFRIIPEVNRLFIHVRDTNVHALAHYKQLGFTPFGEQPNYWLNLEYNAEQNDALQKIADILVEIA